MDDQSILLSGEVETHQGSVRGQTFGDVERFLGLPYAAPPLGNLRFRPPAPLTPRSGVREAVTFGPRAMQDTVRQSSLLGNYEHPASEDCLTLNLWRPADGGSELAVMVFIHGGGFYAGAASHPAYDGARLARRGGLIVITIQYRLGALGLLAHPCLSDPDSGHFSNWAMQDQIAALQWVQENVAAFGGNRDNVTLFGESAGGGSVAALCVSPVSRPLFRRAIIQSSSPLPATAEMHRQAAEAYFDAVGVAPDLDALQTLSPHAIVAAQDTWINSLANGRTAPRPMIDGTLLPDWPDAGIDLGLTDGLDIMVTYNRDETTFTALRLGAERVPTSEQKVKATLGQLRPQADALYAAFAAARAERGEAVAPYDIWVALKTDQMIRVPALEFLARHGARGNRAWAGCVTWESGWRPAQNHGRPLGACHVIELPLLFGTYGDTAHLERLAGGDGVERVSATIQDAWIAFARSGDPNCASLPNWPTYDPGKRNTMMLGGDNRLEADPRGPERSAMKEALENWARFAG